MSGSSSALLQAARFWERTSARGVRYMSGRLGGVKVVILPNRNHIEGDPVHGHTHVMFFQDGSSTSSRPAERAPAEPRERQCKVDRPNDRQQMEDDPVPF